MAHPDLNNLLNSLLPSAQNMLSKYAEFYPFGATLDSKGKISSEAAYTGEDKPLSQPLIELMTAAFKQYAKENKIIAAGMCMDVRTIPPGESQKTDAILMGLEHVSGESIDVYLPYKKEMSGKISYGNLFASKRKSTFFIPR